MVNSYVRAVQQKLIGPGGPAVHKNLHRFNGYLYVFTGYIDMYLFNRLSDIYYVFYFVGGWFFRKKLYVVILLDFCIQMRLFAIKRKCKICLGENRGRAVDIDQNLALAEAIFQVDGLMAQRIFYFQG